MNELLILMTCMMSELNIIEKMEEAMNEYKLVPTRENYLRIATIAQTLIIKAIVGDDLKEAMKLVANYKRAENTLNLTSLEKLIGN